MTLEEFYRYALTVLVAIAFGIVAIITFGGFSPAMKQHYSMNWLEMNDPFTGEMEDRTVKLPTKGYLYLCSTVGCQKRTRVMMARADIEEAESKFIDVSDPASERKALGKAIAYLELRTCIRNGTCDDSPNITMSRKGQMDCVDEATNTTSYMLWLEMHGFLKHHKVLLPRTQGFPVAHWFAMIRSNRGGDYIVESDFNRTGQEPIIQRR